MFRNNDTGRKALEERIESMENSVSALRRAIDDIREDFARQGKRIAVVQEDLADMGSSLNARLATYVRVQKKEKKDEQAGKFRFEDVSASDLIRLAGMPIEERKKELLTLADVQKLNPDIQP